MGNTGCLPSLQTTSVMILITTYRIHSNSSALGVSKTRRWCINDELRIWPQKHAFWWKIIDFTYFGVPGALWCRGGVYLGMCVYLNECTHNIVWYESPTMYYWTDIQFSFTLNTYVYLSLKSNAYCERSSSFLKFSTVKTCNRNTRHEVAVNTSSLTPKWAKKQLALKD